MPETHASCRERQEFHTLRTNRFHSRRNETKCLECVQYNDRRRQFDGIVFVCTLPTMQHEQTIDRAM